MRFVRKTKSGLLDDRFYRELTLAGKRYVVPFKYQTPRLDLACESEATDADDAEGIDLVVKLSGLYAHTGEESSDPITVPDVVFTVDVGERLFLEGLYEEEEGMWDEKDMPDLVVFKRSGKSGEPNPRVQFVRC